VDARSSRRTADLESTGRTPLAWLHQQRIARTKELLETTGLTVAKIAGRVGLGAPANLRTDPRVDPTELFGLDFGDAIVSRNVGGRDTPFADEDLRRGFAARGLSAAELGRLPVLDPAETVRHDVAILLAYPNLSAHVRVAGWAYDVATGLVSTVTPPQSRAEVS
jgi:hypothetical protein